MDEWLNYHTIHSACIRGDKAQLKHLLGTSEVGLLELKDSSGKTPLIYATIGNHLDCVNHLLKAGVLVDNADHNGQTALHWAVYKGHWQCVKASLEKGALWYKKDLDGVTPLHLAAIHKSSKCLQLILQFDNNYTNYDLWDSAKKTALHWSASVANYEHMKLLLKKDANVNIPDVEGRTPLHWAAACNSPRALDCVKLLLASSPSSSPWQDYQGRTALHMAVIMGTNEVVNALAINDKSQNLLDNMFRTPLHWAAIMGLTEKVKMLLDHGPNLSARDANGATPLHYAAHGDHADTVSAFLSHQLVHDQMDNYGCTVLLWAAARGADRVLQVMKQHGADLHATDQHSNTPLHAASLQGHASTVEWLMDQGCRIDAKNNCGQTPLLLACQVGRAKVLRVLLSKDKSSSSALNITDSKGRTSLHCAAIGGHALICQILLQHKADPNVQDFYGLTPLHYASYKGSLNCMSVLIENGANINSVDNLGQTAVHWACLRGKLEPVKMLHESGAHLNSLTSNTERNNYPTESKAFSNDRFTPLDYARLSGGSHATLLLDYLCENNAVTSDAIINLAALVIQKFLKNCSRIKGKQLLDFGIDSKLLVTTAPDIMGHGSSSEQQLSSYEISQVQGTKKSSNLINREHFGRCAPQRISSSQDVTALVKELSLSQVIFISHIDIPKNGSQMDLFGHCLGCHSEIIIKSPMKTLQKRSPSYPQASFRKPNLKTLAAVVIQRSWRKYVWRKRNEK